MGFFATYRNKILAVFAAFLMAIFMLPSSFKGSGGNVSDPVRATLDGQKIHVSDWKSAHDEYEYVMNSVAIKDDPQGRSLGAAMMPPMIRSEVQTHPDYYLLLIKETQRLGIHIPQEKVEAFIKENVALPPNFTLDDETTLRIAVSHLLAIETAIQRSLTPIKITQPLREHWMAERFQAMKVKLVDFNVAEFKPMASAPTTQQVQDQFTSFGNKDPQAPDPRNAFGFGYRLPNRVKYQWIELRRADVLQAAKATHSDYDWDVAAQKYYRTNPQEFPTTAPASQPVVGTNPGIRPFAEIHQPILDKLQNAEADRLESAILARINSLMSVDYSEYKANPISPPKTTFGTAFPDYAYLEKLAVQIQSEFKILPAVVSMGDYKTQQQIAETGIAKATLNSVDAATYLTTQIEPLATADLKGRALKIDQPSPAMRDDAGNVYIVRVTDAQAARMPGAMTDVTQQIDSDLRTVQAFTLARNAARGLATAAQQGGLEKAAALAGRKVISAGPFSTDRPEIPGYPLPQDSLMPFFLGTGVLLQTDAKTSPHPLTVVELPRAGKVAVAELEDVLPANPMFDPTNKLMVAEMSSDLDSEITQRYARNFLIEWLDYDQIATRLNYVVDESSMRVQKKPAPGAEPPAQPSPFQ